VDLIVVFTLVSVTVVVVWRKLRARRDLESEQLSPISRMGGDFQALEEVMISSLRNEVNTMSGSFQAALTNSLGVVQVHSARTDVLSGKLDVLEGNIRTLNQSLALHAELARMRLGLDQSDPKSALARLRSDLERVRSSTMKRHEALSRKAGVFLAELERVADEYEIAQLLSECEKAAQPEVERPKGSNR